MGQAARLFALHAHAQRLVAAYSLLDNHLINVSYRP